jgi:hypothetical protein
MGRHLAEIFAFRWSTLLEENILILHDVLFIVVTVICTGGKKSQRKRQ